MKKIAVNAIKAENLATGEEIPIPIVGSSSGGGSNVRMKDNDVAGVDLSVDNVTRTLVKQDDFDTTVTNHETRIEELEETGSDVTDVKINGTSILNSDKVANIPIANSSNAGVIKTYSGNGFGVDGAGNLNGSSRTLEQYNSASDNLNIAKGTLENVLKARMYSGKFTAKRDATFTNLIQLVVGGVNANSRVFVTPMTTLPTNGFITRVSLGANVVQVVLNTAFAENTDYTFMVLVDNS